MPMIRNLTQSMPLMLIAALVSVSSLASEPRHSERYGDDYRSAYQQSLTSIYRYTVEAALEVDDHALAEEAMSALEALSVDDEHARRARELMAEEG